MRGKRSENGKAAAQRDEVCRQLNASERARSSECRMSSSAPFSITAQALHDDIRHTRKLSLGCAVLDRVLGGGIDVQGITEVAGSAGAGKTQLVLRCLLHVQLPPSEGGLSGGAIYIFSEGSSQPSMRPPVLTRPRASEL